MNIRQILLILRLRWLLVLAASVVACAVATFVSLRLPKVYTTQTALLLDIKVDPLVASLMPAMASPAFLATQSHIIRSDNVAALVIDRLGLNKNNEAIARWKETTLGKVPIETFYSRMLQNGLVVEPVAGTNVLNISFTSSDPKFAATIANAYARAYIDFSIDLRTEPAKQYAAFFDDRAKELKAVLEKAKAALLETQRKQGIALTGQGQSDEVAKLSALTNQLASAVAERTQADVMARNSGRETSPDVQQSSSVQALRLTLTQLESKFSDTAAQFGTSHPQYQQLQQQINVTRQQLAAEIRRVSTTSSAVTQLTDQKISQLRAQIASQKERVLGLKGGVDDVESSLKDVEMAQRAYDTVVQRRAQVSLESRSDLATARVLTVATEPLAPSKPNVKLNILLGALGGAGLGTAIAFLLEFMDRRIRSEADLLSTDGPPVLLVMTDYRNNTKGLPQPLFGFLPAPGRTRAIEQNKG